MSVEQLLSESTPSLAQMEGELRDGRTPWNYRERERATACRRGHAYTVDNTRWRSDGRRECRTCINARQRAEARPRVVTRRAVRSMRDQRSTFRTLARRAERAGRRHAAEVERDRQRIARLDDRERIARANTERRREARRVQRAFRPRSDTRTILLVEDWADVGEPRIFSWVDAWSDPTADAALEAVS
jgi:hypothetical protein